MRILIGTDGSEFSKAAIRECCKFVSLSDETEIKVVSVFEDSYPIAAEPFAVSAEFYQEIVDAAENQAKHFAEEGAEILRGCSKDGGRLKIETKVMRGTAGQQIIEEAEIWKADMIVVGSHGRGFWGRMLGSVSDAVTHHAPCSVLVVRRPPVDEG